ncbi:MAG: hypothetical protein J5I50_13235 [Chitinophagaceae bacterium]|nr:hypothetical protein [Chitinophagaceae bacterium]
MKKTASVAFALCFILFSLSAVHKTFANAAQPGIWNAGGTVFTMLYPEDSAAFNKVQMQREQVYIQLYKGYAVVKGVYLFRNTTGEHLSFKMGYPVNGIYAGGAGLLNEVRIDSLSRFKIKSNDEWMPVLDEEINNYEDEILYPSGDNWKVWQMDFLPNESKTVTVYFLVSTNNSSVHRGYNVESRSAFIYLLESGSVWFQPIEKGNFYVQLNDGLKLKDVKGISGGFGFRFNKDRLVFAGEKINFSPKPHDNLVITLPDIKNSFSFEAIIPDAENLFSKMDEFSASSLDALTYEEVPLNDPYDVDGSIGSFIPILLTLLVIALPVIIVLIIIFFIVRYLKNLKRK